MFSTRSKKLFLAVIAMSVALVGSISPTGAFATSARHNPIPAKSTVLNASQKHPVLAIPGDIINVTLPTGVVQVQIVGPKVPQVSADALPGEFDFTFIQKKGSSVIDVRDFGILDGNATLIRPVQFNDGSKRFTLRPGEKKTFSITELMAVGTGTLRWAPLNHYVVDWQFVEETA